MKLDVCDMQKIEERLAELPTFSAKALEGFACSASDNSCGCGWDCSSSKT